MKRISFALLLALGVIVHPRVVSTQVTPRTYLLAEGATGPFFDTDILLANPQSSTVPVNLTFFKEDGSTVSQDVTLPATSRTTIRVDNIAGLDAAAFSTIVTSSTGAEIVVERTMRWDASGYGAHTEKATAGAATDWFFAEGSQGFFFTYLLLVNPQNAPNVAHVTFLREGAPPVVRDYPLLPSSRRTIVAGDDAELVNTSFGARVRFDAPGVAERAMYFGLNPLFTGGHESAGVTAPSTNWFLAEGATGSFFTTFILLANPDAQNAQVTVTYLPDGIAPIARSYAVPAGQRLTINIAAEDPSLASAAVGARIESDRPIIVERAQYWPNPFQNWYEAHNSFGLTDTGTRWGLAEGRVGGTNGDQTYILLANPGTAASSVHMQFLRTNGTVVNKDFVVPATSRTNVAVTGPGSQVPELNNESFSVIIEATQPIAVERSLYSNVGGATWSAGTNATATRLSPPQPLTVTVAATDNSASEAGLDPGTFTFTRTGGSPAATLNVFFTLGGTASNGGDYESTSQVVTFPAGQATVAVPITPRADNSIENDETVIATITPNQNYAVGTPNTATITLADNVATISVVATDATASEPGTDTGTFTFTRTTGGNPQATLNVFFTLGGTASNGGDYESTSQVITFPPNVFTATVNITPRADNSDESTETAALTINPNSAYRIDSTNNAANVTIADSTTVVSVVATDATASEAPTDTATFTFTRTAAGNPQATMNLFFTLGGTASNGGDYASTSQVVTFPPNVFTVTATIAPRRDNDDEDTETVALTLNTNDAYRINPLQNAANASIADDTAVISIVATDPTASETGPETGTFTVTRSDNGNTAAALNVFFTLGGTAANGSDYVSTSQVVTIPANVLSASVTITPIADGPDGPDTVIATINTNGAYIVAAPPNNTATITINP